MGVVRKKVRKGLEVPLLIKGMRYKDFYALLGLILLGFVYVVGCAIAALMDKISLLAVGINIVFVLVVLVCSLLYFQHIAVKKRYNFKKTASTLSNRDLLHYL